MKGWPSIGELVEIPAVQTVIRLEEGRQRSRDIAHSFVFTEEVAAHFTVLADALLQARGQGYFLQGDFGSGKSHFLAALSAWLGGREGGALLSQRHGGLRRVEEAQARFLPVDISLVNYRATTPLEQIVLEGVERALASCGRQVSLTPRSSFLQTLQELLGQEEAAGTFADLAGIELRDIPQWLSDHPRRAYAYGLQLMSRLGLEAPQDLVEERHESFAKALASVQEAGFQGLVLIIDELSEFFRSKPSTQALNEDARTLQLLGEMASRQPLWVVAAVQESIERTGDISQAIFRKIKDRFPIKLALSTVHIRALISQRLVRCKQGAEKEIYRIFEHYRQQFPTFQSSYEEFRSSYPVHPVTIALLDGLGELFSQHRGVVDFVYARIAGDKSRRIPSILDRPGSELLAPDSIYQHFAQRLAEFSAFNIYPRHIVPHLNQIIDQVLEHEEDRVLSRRLVRMLVLYRIHPTAQEPTVAQLAELAACSLESQSPDLNARFVAETLLDPIAAASPFLSKRRADPADPLQAIYAIVTEEDPGKTLTARVRHIAGELQAGDARLLLEPLSQLPESESWPGRDLLKEGVERPVSWNASTRRALACFLHPEDRKTSLDRLIYQLNSGSFDYAVVLTLESTPGKEGVLGSKEGAAGGKAAGMEAAGKGEHIAVWQIPRAEKSELLLEFLATTLAAQELSPSNPAQAPLIPLAKERLARLKPAAGQAALEAVYAGRFADREIRVDPAVRQLKRFDRLLEAAGEVLLAGRYPRFPEVAPRRFPPSPRIYQQLLEEFVIPGSLPLREARTRSLSNPIDGLAVPLGLVELKRGSYTFSPDTSGHPLLTFFFGLLQPVEPTPLPQILSRLQQGVFGLPRDTALFLTAALAAGGLVTVLKGGRSVPLEFLTLVSLEKAQALALGELIGQGDRGTLIRELSFLAPSTGEGAFGLRQQRETWKEVVKFRESGEHLIAEIRSRLAGLLEFSSFRSFDLPAWQQKLNDLNTLIRAIKVSYPAKEGLENFLSAWRGTGLQAEDIEFIKRLNRFLAQRAEEFVFINHYLRHQAVEKATRIDGDLANLRRAVLELLEHPAGSIIQDGGERLGEVYSHFREHYGALYSRWHGEFFRNSQKPPLSRNASRALAALRRLAGVQALDRPPGLDAFLREVEAPERQPCRRQISEELMRSPVCGCGFQAGDRATTSGPQRPEEQIQEYLQSYLDILANPRVLELVSARAYALGDANPKIAQSLAQLGKSLKGSGLKAATLVGIMDEGMAGELSQALAGRISIQSRDLSELDRNLAGRRLPPSRIKAMVEQWLGGVEEDTLVAVEGGGPGGVPPLSWWPLLQKDLLAGDSAVPEPDRSSSRELEQLERRLEEQYPAGRLKEALGRLNPEQLLRFILEEPFHTQAVRAAWLILVERILRGEEFPPQPPARSRHAAPERAARIEECLAGVERIALALTLAYPQRLAIRLALDELLTDPWTSAELGQTARQTLEQVAILGEEWLAGVAPVAPISLDRGELVLLLDGVSPDLWLKALPAIQGLPGSASTGWARLKAEPNTVDALARLFGLEGDPAEALAGREIPYHTLSGDEELSLIDYLQPLAAERSTVLRLNIFDRAAHSSKLHLSEMAGILSHLVDGVLPPVCRLCQEQHRPLILTTDHGLSYTPQGLGHGQGGVYERTIFRAEWTY